jgi:diguanylate cyclase (GGDEF)-like protein
MFTVDLTHAQFLWLMVSSQMAIYAGMWLLASSTMKAFGPAMRMTSLFNFFLSISVVLVAVRGTALPDVLTRTGANLAGLAAFVALWAAGSRLFKPDQSLKEPWLVLAISGTAIIVFGQISGYGNHRVAVNFIALAWIVGRSTTFTIASMRQRFGAMPAMITYLIAWGFVAVILVRSFGALVLGWQIEIDRDRPGNLGFAYFVMVCITGINSVLAYISMRSVMFELEALARHDPLTGLLNRRALNQQQALWWDRWQRHQSAFAVICLDIDHFKCINDRWGHDVGDHVLTLVATALQNQVRPMDTLARTGGEEFIVLLDLREPTDDLLQIAERIRQAVQGLELLPNDKGQPLTVSLGVALSTTTDVRPADVVTRADNALYLAKANGRNRVEVAPELQSLAMCKQVLASA